MDFSTSLEPKQGTKCKAGNNAEGWQGEKEEEAGEGITIEESSWWH